MRKMLTIKEVSAVTSLATQTLYNYRGSGVGPPSFSVRGRVRYYEDELEAWLEQEAREHPRGRKPESSKEEPALR